MKNVKHEDKELKKEFQVERLVLFSDAVFAIAITLLIIEIKVPEVELAHLNSHEGEIAMLNSLIALVPRFIGFIVGFIVIAMYWVNHHLLFGLLSDYNRKVIWANLRFLFTIVLMPFSSAFYSDYFQSGLVTPIAFYAINITLSGLAILHLWQMITDPANKLSDHPLPKVLSGYYKVRSVVAALVFMLSFCIAFFSTRLAYYTPLIVIPLVMFVLKMYYRKKAPSIFYKGSEH